MLTRKFIQDIQEVPFQPVIPLNVAINHSCGKMRLILDLSQLNQHVQKKKIKFKDWNIAKDFFRDVKFDQKSGYHHRDLCKKLLTYFAFLWNNKCFTVLPFAMTSAPYIFTKYTSSSYNDMCFDLLETICKQRAYIYQ